MGAGMMLLLSLASGELTAAEPLSVATPGYSGFTLLGGAFLTLALLVLWWRSRNEGTSDI